MLLFYTLIRPELTPRNGRIPCDDRVLVKIARELLIAPDAA